MFQPMIITGLPRRTILIMRPRGVRVSATASSTTTTTATTRLIHRTFVPSGLFNYVSL